MIPRIYIKYAKIKFDTGLYGDCFELLRAAIREYPNDNFLYGKYALYLLWRGHYQESEKMFRKGLELFPSHPDMNLHYATALEKQGKLMQAVSHLRHYETLYKSDGRTKAKLDALTLSLDAR